MLTAPTYGDMRIMPSLVRPARVELHVWDVAPVPERAGWIYAGEFGSVAEAKAEALKHCPSAALTVEM